MSRKTTVFVSPALITSIFCFFTIGFGVCWIVSVTWTFDLLEVARVLDGDLEREVGRRHDRVLARRSDEPLAVRQRRDADEPVPC